MNKTNWIKRIVAFFRRKHSHEHIVECVVYVDGRIIERKETTFTEEYGLSNRFFAMRFANGVTSEAYGLERKRMKGRA